MDDPLLIHIGYPKTGTTWLQRHLFEGRDNGIALIDRVKTKRAFIHPHPLQFDAAASRTLLADELAAARDLGLRPAISQERLAGYSSLGSYDAKEIADRLYVAYPHATILIVLREQSRMILSLYHNRVMYNRNVARPIGQFLRPPRWERGLNKYSSFEWFIFEYHHLIAYYQALFGRDNVHVLLLEQFRRSARAYVEKILRIAAVEPPFSLLDRLPYGERSHSSVSAQTLAIKWRLNRVIGRRTLSNPKVLIPISKRAAQRAVPFWYAFDRALPEALKTRSNGREHRRVLQLMGDRYSESNRITAQLTGIDLEKYGYS